jgi:hypothetical protein
LDQNRTIVVATLHDLSQYGRRIVAVEHPVGKVEYQRSGCVSQERQLLVE